MLLGRRSSLAYASYYHYYSVKDEEITIIIIIIITISCTLQEDVDVSALIGNMFGNASAEESDVDMIRPLTYSPFSPVQQVGQTERQKVR